MYGNLIIEGASIYYSHHHAYTHFNYNHDDRGLKERFAFAKKIAFTESKLAITALMGRDSEFTGQLITQTVLHWVYFGQTCPNSYRLHVQAHIER